MLKVEKKNSTNKRKANVSSSKGNTAKKSRPTPRKRGNLSIEEINLIKKIDEWIKEAIQRERLNEPVFPIKIQAKVVSDICGISEREVYSLRKKEKPGKSTGRKKIVFDDFNKRALSRLVLGFYRREVPEIPTLEKIYKEASEIPGFPQASESTLLRELKKLGFVYRRRNKKMQIYQRLDIVAERHKVLRKLPELRKNGYKIFYQDETWCNANSTREYIWQTKGDSEDLIEDTKWKGGMNVPSGSGRRLIINHIGSENGFLEGCGECFEGKKNTSDYHNEMNSTHFENWWEVKVLPALPDKSVVLIDNAKYHSRQTDDSKKPTTAWRKDRIKKWLEDRNVPFAVKDTKPVLLQKSKEIFVAKKYELEELTKRYCEKNKKDISIFRLPIGHSELNAIELIWAQVKTEVAEKNTTFKLKDVKELMENALKNVTPENWKKAISHTIRVEDAFRKTDFSEKDDVERVIIDLGLDSDSSQCSTDSDSD